MVFDCPLTEMLMQVLNMQIADSTLYLHPFPGQYPLCTPGLCLICTLILVALILL